jgi:intracellular multiplication protein IcmP
MANSAQQSQQNSDNSLAILWGLLFVFAASWLIWFFFHDWIASFILKLRILEAKAIACFIPKARPWVTQLQSLPIQDVQFSDISRISVVIGHYLRIPISLILLGFAGSIYFNRATLRFKRQYSMQTLAEEEAQNWPQITPIIPLDLVNTPIDSGPWAMGLTPLQFAKKHDLIHLERITPQVSTAVTTIHDQYLQAKLKRTMAKRTLTIQLGSYWKGIEALSMPRKALFAIFAARAARDSAAANQLLSQISQSAAYYASQAHPDISHLNFIGTEHLLRKHCNYPLVQETIQRHAYVLTVMASMLVLARQDGVLASADFLWLKPCDRTLWFMLNCVGRQTAYTEVAAPFAHWIAERALGHRLQAPMIDTTLEALEIALREVRLPPDTSMQMLG